jgi:hypothetical protein
MAFALRLAFYVAGGGLLLAWINPPPGLLEYALLLATIVAAAYLDEGLTQSPRSRGQPSGVVRMGGFRSRRNRRPGPARGKGDRPPLRPLYSTSRQTEVEGLLAVLRAKGLNPIMVTQKRAGGEAALSYEVRLPENELKWGQPILLQFVAGKHFN